MTLVDDEQVVETLLTDRTHPACGKRIDIRGSNGCVNDFDLLCSKYLIEGGRKFGIVTMKEIANGWRSLFEFPAELPGLLRDPNRNWVFGSASDMDTASSQFDEEENTDRFQPEGFDGEEITGQHLVLVMADKGAPGAFR